MERVENWWIVEAASALADWFIARRLAFEFASEHSGRRGYFFHLAAKLWSRRTEAPAAPLRVSRRRRVQGGRSASGASPGATRSAMPSIVGPYEPPFRPMQPADLTGAAGRCR